MPRSHQFPHRGCTSGTTRGRGLSHVAAMSSRRSSYRRVRAGWAALPLCRCRMLMVPWTSWLTPLDTLKLVGVVLFSNSNWVYLGDAGFEPVFAELERRGTVVFVHPTASPDPSAHRLGLPDSLIDFTADTTRAVAQMRYSNRFARTPKVKYIFSHAGGTAPYLAGGPRRPRASATGSVVPWANTSFAAVNRVTG
jgi:hypothetical protein